MKHFLKENWELIGFGVVVVLALIVIGLTGCKLPTADPGNQDPGDGSGTPVVTIVKNSLWQDVSVTTLEKSLGRSISRELSDSELLDAVAEYNTGNIDDFLRVYYDAAPGIEDSPPVDVFIVNPVTYEVNMEQNNIARTLLVDNAAGWRHDAQGQLLFIDHVPPPPIITPPASMYAWYAIYEVDNTTGAIVHEDHCGYNPDESFTGQWITDPNQGGWATVDAYYQTILHGYQQDAVVTANNVHVVTRELYTP